MLKRYFFLLIVKPFILFAMGLHVKGRQHLIFDGPSIIVANHNSHLDTFILMSLFPVRIIERVKPVAAADYFFKYRFLKWFSINIIGIIPIKRQGKASKKHPLQGAIDTLNHNNIVIVFPEGSRGEPEQMGSFKTGVAHLAKLFPDVPVIPVNIYGAGKSLPRGEALFVPFIADIFIGEPIYFATGTVAEFRDHLEGLMATLQVENKI